MSKKTLLPELTRLLYIEGRLTEYQSAHRCPRTGIAWIEDGSTGMGHSCHPNIHASGSVRGMKKNGYWRKDAVVVQSHGFKYNTSVFIVSDKLDKLAADLCRCGGRHD